MKTTISVYAVKWGTKYTAKHVNRLFADVRQNTTRLCNFFCLTEDPTGLDSYIIALPFPADNSLVKWWNKMYLWDPTIVYQKGEKVFFDLDLIIQKNIDPILDYNPEDCLTFVKTHWHNLEKQWTETRHVPHRYTDLNSSVLRWNDNLDWRKIDDYFRTFRRQILWYYRGIDNFYGHRSPVNIKFFPLGWAYSFNNGYIWPHDVERHVYRELPYVCIFDSMGNTDDIKFEL